MSVTDDDGVEWLTPAELADRLGRDITPQTVYDWIRSGRLNGEGVRRGNRRVWVTELAGARAERDTRDVGRPRGS